MLTGYNWIQAVSLVIGIIVVWQMCLRWANLYCLHQLDKTFMLVSPEETRLALLSCPNWTCALFFHFVLSQPPQNTKKVRRQLLMVLRVTDRRCAHCRTEFFDKELCAAMYTHFNPACMHMSVLFPIRNFLKLRIKLSYTSFTSSAAVEPCDRRA